MGQPFNMETNQTVRMHFYLSRFEAMLNRYNTVINTITRKAGPKSADKLRQSIRYDMSMVVPTLEPGGIFPCDDQDHGYIDLPYHDARRMVGFYNSFVKSQKKRIKNCRHKEVTLEMLISDVPSDMNSLIDEFDALDYEGWK